MDNLTHLGIDSDGELIKESRRGCLFYGCLTSVIILVIGIILVATGGWWLVDRVADRLVEVSETKRLELPKITYSSEEYKSTKARIDDFALAIEEGQSCRLELNGTDINLLIYVLQNQQINGKDNLHGLEKYVRFQISDGKIKGKMSIPLELFKLERFSGRYLNGRASFELKKDKGQSPSLYVTNLRIATFDIPPEVQDKLKTTNLFPPLVTIHVSEEEQERLREEDKDLAEFNKMFVKYINDLMGKVRQGIDQVDRVFVEGDKMILEKD